MFSILKIFKPIFTIIFIVVCIFIATYYLKSKNNEPFANADYKAITYKIQGVSVLLSTSNETPTTSETVTRYFGNEARADLNADGREDVVFLVTQNGGGSGTFYYLVGALTTPAGYVAVDGTILGDRIAPQTTEIHDGQIFVNYADRKAGEPMSAQPSLGKSIWFKVDLKNMQFGEVVKNFEGEADPNRMTLGMKTWTWVKTTYSDGTLFMPKKEGVFALTFEKDGRFGVKTDCNAMGGEYEAKVSLITFKNIVSTQRFCEGSQEGAFSGMLEKIQSYHFTSSKGELIFDLKMDSGTVIFR